MVTGPSFPVGTPASEETMEPVSEFVPCSSIRVFLMMENRLLREALIRLFRKRSDLVVVGHDEPADATPCPVLDGQFDVLLIDSLQTTWPAAKIARANVGHGAYKAVLIGMEPDEELFMAAVRSGVMGYLLKDASASELVAAVRAVYRGEAVCPPQLCATLFRFVAHVVEETPVKRTASKPDLTLRQQQLAPPATRSVTADFHALYVGTSRPSDYLAMRTSGHKTRSTTAFHVRRQFSGLAEDPRDRTVK